MSALMNLTLVVESDQLKYITKFKLIRTALDLKMLMQLAFHALRRCYTHLSLIDFLLLLSLFSYLAALPSLTAGLLSVYLLSGHLIEERKRERETKHFTCSGEREWKNEINLQQAGSLTPK